MPHLPLNTPEPLSATLGIMLYPEANDIDNRNARAFSAQYLAKPIQQAVHAGIPVDSSLLLENAMSCGERLEDLDERWYWGTAVGEMFTTFFALANSDPQYASWHRAITIAKQSADDAKTKGKARSLEGARNRFASVAHLWAAWSIRDQRFIEKPGVGYDNVDDFFSFITEAEILLQSSRTWSSTRSKSRAPLPEVVWRAEPDWRPPVRLPDWPDTGRVPRLTFPPEFLDNLKLPGRPRKVSN